MLVELGTARIYLTSYTQFLSHVCAPTFGPRIRTYWLTLLTKLLPCENDINRVLDFHMGPIILCYLKGKTQGYSGYMPPSYGLVNMWLPPMVQ
jgi:hypothetical protein